MVWYFPRREREFGTFAGGPILFGWNAMTALGYSQIASMLSSLSTIPIAKELGMDLSGIAVVVLSIASRHLPS